MYGSLARAALCLSPYALIRRATDTVVRPGVPHQVRAALVSAVYKKALRLGPSARNKRTQVTPTPVHWRSSHAHRS